MPFPLPLPINEAITTGNCIIDEAKITGITPAVLTFSGMFVDCPPTDFLPCTSAELTESGIQSLRILKYYRKYYKYENDCNDDDCCKSSTGKTFAADELLIQ